MLKILLLLASFSVNAATHVHAKHNMVMYGENEIFVSHLVYKVPHNYQVILDVDLDSRSKEKYLAAKKSNPEAQFIFLLDEMDIKDIEALESISGTVFFTGGDGQKVVVLPTLSLTKESFKVVFFNELPLSLEGGH